ncbi:MAG: PQQ-dependent sugar dehydrogenase [Agarilytica sp.]
MTKTPLLISVIFSFALLINCGGGGSSSNKGAEPSPSPSIERPSNLTCIPPETSIEPGTMGLEAAFPSLPSTSSTVAMTQATNDSSMWFLIKREGYVYAFDNDTSVDTLTEALDISSKIASTENSEYGLSGIAIHPSYPTDNRVFLLYNDGNNNARSTIASFSINTTTHAIDENSESVLLTLDQNTPYHNGGDLHFGIDGMLYAAFGDDETSSNAQLLTNLYGTLIRIDVSGSPYSIPSDNPYAGSSRCDSNANAAGQDCPEIFAHGFRNPWRFSIDMQTGLPWVGDVGEDSFEEVDRVESGGNYGWPIVEGNSCSSAGCDTSLYDAPISVYGRDQGVSVNGGYVYRGTQSTSLTGQYIFGDVFTNRYFQVSATATSPTTATEIFNSQRMSFGMAQGNDGEIYLLSAFPSDTGEMIYRITDGTTSTHTMPSALSDTGCFNTQTKSSATGVIDYTNITPLWSDGATKLRSFAIPNESQITVLADGEFRFPDDAILIKHFLNDETFLETRLLVNHPSGWRGYSYEWNDAQTDAVLLTEGKTKDVGEFIHTYPSANQCSLCHIGSDASLGLEAIQINRDYAPLGTNIINYLNDAGYFINPQSNTDHLNLFAVDDTSATLEQRARSYLHSNCSGCHRPGTGNRVSMDLRFTSDLTDTNTCNVDASLGDLGISNALRISPGNADASVLLLRMETLDGDDRMPPLASLSVDTTATQVVRDWINSLSNCN